MGDGRDYVTHALQQLLRETADVRSDPETLRGLAEAPESVRAGDVVYGGEAVRVLVERRHVS